MQIDTRPIEDVHGARSDASSIDSDEAGSSGYDTSEEMSDGADDMIGIDDDIVDFSHFTQEARSKRVAQRGLRYSESPEPHRDDRLSVKRKRVVRSESRSSSKERPERPPAGASGPAIPTSTNTSSNTPVDVGKTSTPAPTHAPEFQTGNPTPPIT
jgi:hypothetical protein